VHAAEKLVVDTKRVSGYPLRMLTGTRVDLNKFVSLIIFMGQVCWLAIMLTRLSKSFKASLGCYVCPMDTKISLIIGLYYNSQLTNVIPRFGTVRHFDLSAILDCLVSLGSIIRRLRW